MTTISQRFADHAATTTWADLPDAARQATRILFLDTLGVGVAGANHPESRRVADVCASWGGRADASVWGTGQALPALHAAMVTSHQVHCLEFDSIHEPAVVHPMTVVLPVLVADAQRRRAQGETILGPELAAATAVGVDIAGGLGDVTTTALQFFRPGTAGLFGAVASVGNARRLPAEVITNAIGIALGEVSGTMQPHTEGSTLLPMQVAFNARSAITAIDLAMAGATGPLEVFEGPFGYFRLIEAGGEPDVLADRLGSHWEVAVTSIKPFPSGRATHSAIDGVLQLREQHRFSADDVESVHIDVPPMIHGLCSRTMVNDPTPNFVRLSIPFQVASALIDGFVDLTTARAERLTDPEIRRHAEKVSLAMDGNPDPNAFDPQKITVTLRNGQSHSITLPRVLGAPPNPLSRDQLEAKVRSCLAYGAPTWPSDRGDRLIDLVGRIDELDDAGPILDLL
jgi:aconitate decarboxylase